MIELFMCLIILAITYLYIIIKIIILHILDILGFIAIVISAFTIPSNPHEIIPALTVMIFEKTLWVCIVFDGDFLYLLVLYSIYNLISLVCSFMFIYVIIKLDR